MKKFSLIIVFLFSATICFAQGSFSTLNVSQKFYLGGKLITNITGTRDTVPTYQEVRDYVAAHAGGGTNFWADRGSNRISNNNTSYVGINNSSPSYMLDVNGSAALLNHLAVFTNDGSANFYLGGSGTAGEFGVAGVLGTNFLVTSSGNVGIGVDAPSARLNVFGSTKFEDTLGTSFESFYHSAVTNTAGDIYADSNVVQMLYQQNGYAQWLNATADSIVMNATNSTLDSSNYISLHHDKIRIITSGVGAGKVLTSDADGIATWQAAGGGSNFALYKPVNDAPTYTIPEVNSITILPDILLGITCEVELPDPSSNKGAEIIIISDVALSNDNSWAIGTSNAKDPFGNFITSLFDKTSYRFVSDSVNWIQTAITKSHESLDDILHGGSASNDISLSLYGSNIYSEVTTSGGDGSWARMGRHTDGTPYFALRNSDGSSIGEITGTNLTESRNYALPDASGTIPVMGDYVNPGNFNVDGTLGATNDILPGANIYFGSLDNSLRKIYYVDGLTHHQGISIGGFSSDTQGEGFSQAFVGEDPDGLFKGYNGMASNGAPVMTTEGTDGSFSRLEQSDTAINIVSTDGAATGSTTISTYGVSVTGNIIASGSGGQGNISATGNAHVSGTVSTGGYTVATLPAPTAGSLAYVTDALAPSYLVPVVGGGTVITPVFGNGTAWVAH